MVSLEPRVALITGATARIGEALAHRFSEVGMNLVLVGRRTDKSKKLANTLKTYPYSSTGCERPSGGYKGVLRSPK